MYLLILGILLPVVNVNLVNIYKDSIDNTLLLLCTELLKCAFVYLVSNHVVHKCPSYTPFRWKFVVNSFCYMLTNTMAWWLMQNIDKSSFFLAVQHKILWVVTLSYIILRKTYNMKQLLGACLVTAGAMVSQLDGLEQLNMHYMHYIVIMCVISAFSGVWIELMMKKDRGELKKLEKLYYYLNDSLHMYILGLPFYFYSYWHSPNKHKLNIELSFLICISHALQGIVIGSMFVYYSAVWRSIQSSFTIVVLMILDSQLKLNSFAGLFLIMLGSYCWSLKIQSRQYTKLETNDNLEEIEKENV